MDWKEELAQIKLKDIRLKDENEHLKKEIEELNTRIDYLKNINTFLAGRLNDVIKQNGK